MRIVKLHGRAALAAQSQIGGCGTSAVTALLVAASTLVLAGIANARCTTFPYNAPQTRGGDGAYYWYEAADMRGGAECTVDEPDGSEFTVRFVPDDEPNSSTANRWNSIMRVEVTRKDGQMYQRLQSDRGPLDSPPPSVPYLRVDDVDFDGYPDLGVFVRFEIPGNALYAYWLYDPSIHRFEKLVAPPLSNPRLDAGAKTVITESKDGGAGKLFTRTTYSVRNRKLEAIEEESQRWIDGRYVHETRNLASQDAPLKREVLPEDSRAAYDTRQWRVVTSKRGRVVPGSKVARVDLLAAREVTDLSGFDVPEYDANLVIFDGEHVVYRLRDDPPHPRQRPNDGPHDCTEPDDLELLDVTGDGVVEVMFRCGSSGVSDWTRKLHILHYDADRGRFDDIAQADFTNHGLGGVEWRTVAGVPIALTGHGQWREDEGHYSAHYYDYKAYCWDPQANAFIVAYQATSDVKLGDEEWRPDLEKRLDAIRDAARTSCLHATPAKR